MSRDWGSILSRLQHLADALEKDLDERDRLEDSNRSGQRPGRAAKKKLNEALTCLGDVKDMVTGRAGRDLQPEQRRQIEGTLDELGERLHHLEERYEDGPQYPELAREELLEGHDWGMGVGNETSLDVEELLEFQRQTMQDQDRGLDSLAHAIGQQRAVGQAVFDEVEEQNMLLDDLEENMGRTGGGVDRVTSQTRRFLASDTAKKGCVVLLVLLILIIVLVVLVIVF